jgi:hypothetical protein
MGHLLDESYIHEEKVVHSENTTPQNGLGSFDEKFAGTHS